MRGRISASLIALLLAGIACTSAPPPAPPTAAPAAPPPPPTAVPPPMANKLILFGDMALFAGASNPENCVLKSRYKRGEPVGFRMSAVEPLTGKFAETAELEVNLSYGGKTEKLPMRYRGVGNNPRPGFWTVKWVVPDDAPDGIVRYTVTAKDKEGRTAEFKPFDIEASLLTIVS